MDPILTGVTQTTKHKISKKPRWKTREAANGEVTTKKEKRRLIPRDFGFRAAKAVDLPIDITPGVAHLEFSGNREIVVEGCRGVVLYDENMTILDLGKMKVRFLGHSIELRNFTYHSVIVDGFISSVEFLT